jgi:hypothetical protein
MGAGITLIQDATFRKVFAHRQGQQRQDLRLLSYTKNEIPVRGCIMVPVTCGQGLTKTLPLVVVEGDGRCLLGRNWMKELQMKIDFAEVQIVQTETTVDPLLEKYSDLFKEDLGCYSGPKAHIYLQPEVPPVFCKARPLPFALKSDVEKQLQKSVEEGTLEPVQYSDWATPIVCIRKPDIMSIRICGDYKVTTNKAAKLDPYPIPTISDIYAQLAGGQLFSKLDMSQAYHQIELDEESRVAVMLNTHRGLFRPTRLPFGVNSAPGIFQRIMDGLLAGLPGVAVYLDDSWLAVLDDIIVTGPNLEVSLTELGEGVQDIE